MDKNSLPMQLRKKIVDFDLDGAPRGSVTRFCRTEGISRSVFYKIRSQADALANPGEVPLPASRAPKTSPGRTDPAMEELALRTRADLRSQGWGHGPRSVHDRLVRAGFHQVPSRATLARIFTRHGVVVPEPNKRPRSADKRFVFPNPNDLWQLDGTDWILDDPDHTKVVVFQVEDDHSRMILAWSIDSSENGEAAIKVVSDAIRAHGVPLRFLTDNGTAFNQSRRKGDRTAPLERYLKAFGVHTIAGSVAHPETQGKNERLHRTLQDFLTAHKPIKTTARLLELLEEFANDYNNERPHQGLPGLQTPAEAYQKGTKAGPPPLPEPAQPDLFDASGDPDARPARPARPRPYGAYEIGGLVMANRQVRQDGRISISNCIIHVGRSRTGQLLHISVTDDTFELFGPDGEALGVLTRPAPGTNRVCINLLTDAIHYG
jgi:transposase InsO family protein